MKKTARKRQVKRILKLCEKWLRPLGLLWWERVEFVYFEERESFMHEDGAESVMRTRTMWQYLWAEVEVNLQMCADLADEDLEGAFLHEMAHILVNEMSTGGDGHEERVCSRLAQVFRWAAQMRKG